MAKVSETGEIFLTQRTDVLAVPANVTGSRGDQATENSQQTGFAAAIRSAQFDQFTGLNHKIQTLEQTARAAHTCKIADFQHSPNSGGRQVIRSDVDNSRRLINLS